LAVAKFVLQRILGFIVVAKSFQGKGRARFSICVDAARAAGFPHPASDCADMRDGGAVDSGVRHGRSFVDAAELL
jgi:hypothetical protein